MSAFALPEKRFSTDAQAALWSSVDDDGEPFDAKYDVGDFTPEAQQKAVDSVGRFLNTTIAKKNVYDFLVDPNTRSSRSKSSYQGTKRVFDLAGYDLWLTANGHGSGFWDGDWGDDGDFLTLAADAVGESHIFAAGEDMYLE